MNAKKTLASFLRPNWIIFIILFLIPYVNICALIAFLFSTIPAIRRANKFIKKLEEEGKLQNAAAELTSSAAKHYMKGKVVLTPNYVFCKKRGYVFSYDEIAWAYRHTNTTTFLFIPVNTIDSIYLATRTMKPTQVASMGKDKLGEIKNVLIDIYNHNNNCLLGYTDETKAKYKSLKIR